MTRPIEHIATVVRAGDGVVEVELTAQSACASCHARMACGMGESTRKRIEIATPEASAFTAALLHRGVDAFKDHHFAKAFSDVL